MINIDQNFIKFTQDFANILRSIWKDEYHYQIKYLEQGEIDKFHKLIGHPMYGYIHVIDDCISYLKDQNKYKDLSDNTKYYLNKLYYN